MTTHVVKLEYSHPLDDFATWYNVVVPQTAQNTEIDRLLELGYAVRKQNAASELHSGVTHSV
jgi:hypothetical protein